jgi:PAS domain S-box-containing protein
MHSTDTAVNYAAGSRPAGAHAYACDPADAFSVLRVDETVFDLTGYHAPAFLDDPNHWLACVHEDDRARFDAARREAVADGVASVDYRFRHANGGIVWLRDAMRLTGGGTGAALELTGTQVDVTDLIAEPRQLAAERDENRRLRSLLADSPSMIYRYHVPSVAAPGPWTAQYVSANIKDQLGYEPSEFCAEKGFWAARIHPKDVDRVLAGLTDVFDRDDHTHEYRFRHRDGSYRRMRDRLRIIRDKAGTPVEAVGSWQDVTELEEARQLRRDDAERLRSVMEAAVDGIITIGAGGVIESANASAAAMFGYVPGEMRGRNVSTLMPEPHKTAHDGYLAGYMRTGTAGIIGVGREVEGLRKDGTVFPMDLSVGEASIGGKTLFTGIVRDITDRKASQEWVASINEELEDRVAERIQALADETAKHRATAELAAGRAAELEQFVRQARCILWRGRAQRRGDRFMWHPDLRDDAHHDAFLALDRGEGEHYYDAWRRSMLPADRERVDEGWLTAMREGSREHHAEYRCKANDGEIRWFRDDVSIEPAGKDEWLIVSVTTDITERERVAQTEAVLAEVLEAAHDASTDYEMYERIHKSLAGLLDMTAFAVALVDPDQEDAFVFPYWADESGPVSIDEPITIPRSRTAVVARARHTLYITAAQSQERAAAGDIDLHGAHPAAWLGTPLIVEDRLLGVLRVMNHAHADPYTAREVDIITYVAQQVAIAIDRRAAHSALRAEQRIFQSIMDSVPDTIYVKDRESRFVRINELGARALGKARAADVVGLTDRDFLPPEDAQQLRDEEDEIMRTAVPIIGQVGGDGGTLWMSTTKVPIKDDSGDVVGLVGVNREISDVMAVQDALRREQRLFENLMAHVPDVIYIRDMDLRFVRVNRACATALGFDDPEQLVGLACSDVLPDHLACEFREEELEVLRTGDPVLGRVGRGGSGKWVSMTKVPLRDGDGVITGLVGIHRDMSKIVSAQEELRESETQRTKLIEQMLAVQEEERARIARELHDQVGQELTSVLVGLRVIESAASMQDAIAQAAALRGVTSNTLEDVRQIAFDMRPSSLDDLGVETALARDLEVLGQNAGFATTFRVHNDEGIELPADLEVGLYRLAHTAFTNIARHAEASNVDVVMDMRSFSGGYTLSLLVQDDGVGFDAEAVLAGPVEGRFGLLSMQERARLLDGEVSVESIVGDGSTVLVEITRVIDAE